MLVLRSLYKVDLRMLNTGMVTYLGFIAFYVSVAGVFSEWIHSIDCVGAVYW